MGGRVGIVGVGHSKFGKRSDVTLRELSFEAVSKAFEDSRLEVGAVDSVVTGIATDAFSGQIVPAAPVLDYIGLVQRSNIRVEAACATGSAAVRTGWSLIQSGLSEVVLVLGVETMTHTPTPQATEIMAGGGDGRWEYPFGITFPGFYALLANAHMSQFGTSKEQLAMVAVKNHKYGALNPNAHFQKEISLETALKAPTICHPLSLYDCSPISDGSAAVLLASEERARKITDTPVWIKGLGASTDTMLISERETLTGIKATRLASEKAYKMAGVEPKDVDVANVHDCFTIAEILAYEDLGFCAEGMGGRFIEEGQSYIGGATPVNVDGGLKAKGHPLGATGVSMTVEITKQLRGQAGNRQVKGAEIGLSHNVGQTGQFVFVHIYTR